MRIVFHATKRMRLNHPTFRSVSGFIKVGDSLVNTRNISAVEHISDKKEYSIIFAQEDANGFAIAGSGSYTGKPYIVSIKQCKLPTAYDDIDKWYNHTLRNLQDKSTFFVKTEN